MSEENSDFERVETPPLLQIEIAGDQLTGNLSLDDRALKVTTMIRQIKYSEHVKTFHKHQLAMLVFDSNRMDSTISTRFTTGGSGMSTDMSSMILFMIDPCCNLVDIVPSIDND